MSQSGGAREVGAKQAGYGSRLDKALLEAGLLIIGNFPSKYLKRQGTITYHGKDRGQSAERGRSSGVQGRPKDLGGGLWRL